MKTMFNKSSSLVSVSLLSLALVACGDDTGGSGGGGTGGSGQGGSATGEPVCVDPSAVACEDQVVLLMNLQDDRAPGLVANTADGAGWVSTIDATAGGAFPDDPHSYVYARFTDEGLVKVELSDEEALVSMDWDIAFRRYVVRINSGNSGPSCVSAARVPGSEGYEALTSAPDSLTLRTDEYFTAPDSCEIIADGTGLPGSPATALSSYWTYPGCVQMTGNVFVVQPADGRKLKLIVDRFYSAEAQEQCQAEGTIPANDSGSANFSIRWSYL
jgi:hypothetical protein